MAFTVYTSGDGSAPSLTGVAGSLVTVLDAVLVNGYGAKAAAGWTKAYTAANRAAYKLGSGTGFYLDVLDTAPGAGGAREVRITGYETMSALSTGTGPFPAAGQGASGAGYGVVRKSATADATVRSWIAFADSRTLYFFCGTGDVAGTYMPWMFGDYFALNALDTRNCLWVARGIENSNSMSTSYEFFDQVNAVNTVTPMHYVPRTWAGTGGSLGVAKHGDNAKGGSAQFLNAAGAVQAPNSVDNAYYLSPLWITEASGPSVRGRMRGFWQLGNTPASFSDGQTFTGIGDYAGKTFQVVKSAPSTAVFCIETSNTLETN